VRHLLLQRDAVALLWSTSDDKTVKVWSVPDVQCSSSALASIATINLPCVALVCETVETYSAVTVEGSRSVWMGCDDHLIRVWSCKKQQLSAELKHHKVACATLRHLRQANSFGFSGLGDSIV
jgi:hypothetical protein